MNFPHILVIAASAGSGKTFALSKRYIDLLLSPTLNVSPRSILAITFTNKAAGEMKERIIFHLKEIALGDSGMKESACRKLSELLDRYSDLKVQTIDSFLRAIAMASALELGLPPRFEIVMDSSPALNFVLDELLSHVHPVNVPDGDSLSVTPASGALGSCQRQQKDITRLFLGLVHELLRVDTETGWDIKEVILKNVRDLREQGFLKGWKLKKAFSYEDIARKRDKLGKRMKSFLESGGEALKFKKHFLDAAGKFIKDKQYQPWESRMFLKKEVTELCKKDSLPSPEHRKAWDGIRRELAFLAEITAHCRFAPFLDFINLFEEGLRSFKNRRQVVFIEDLNVQLKTFLVKEGIVPEVYFHLGDRVAHFFIDEFQDTSRLQWENLFPLIEETLSKAGSLFYVGDKKQAIYGFRGGESALFDEAKTSFPSVEERNVEERFPETNYRSRENIVSFINKTFSRENLALWAEANELEDESLDLSFLLDTYTHVHQIAHQKEDKEGGLVRVERISPRDPLSKEDMETEIGKRLTGLIRDDIIPRFSPCDVAILVRTNKEASWVTGVLTGAGIPVASEKTLDISSNNLVRELVSFLAFLDSPTDNFSFAGFISGDIFLKTSALAREEILSFLLENRKSPRPLYPLFREKFPQVWQEYIEEYFQAVGFLPPYDLISRILKKYGVFQGFPDEEGFFYQFLEALKQSEAEEENSLKAFLDFWHGGEEKKDILQVVLPEYTDAIRVLTIHKAKGLGFPIVIVPFACLNNAPVKEVYEKQDGAFIPYRINKKYVSISSKLKELYQERFTAQVLDELNAFYVALTRAEDELYVFVPHYKNRSGKLAAPILLEDSVLETGSPLVRSARPSLQKGEHLHLPITKEWQERLHRPPIHVDELTDAARKKAQERGTLIHNFLAGIERLPENWREDPDGLFGSLREEERKMIPLIKRFFDEESSREWFIPPEDTQVYCEKEIMDAAGRRYVADRVLVSPEKVTVIEFKCGEPRSRKHREQVVTYLKLLAEIFPDKKTEGWLVYVDELTRERVVNR